VGKVQGVEVVMVQWKVEMLVEELALRWEHAWAEGLVEVRVMERELLLVVGMVSRWGCLWAELWEGG
jgi:hypothetical protein